MLMAAGCHLADDETKKIQVREQGRRGEHREHVHRRTRIWIAHQRQLEQSLDRAGSKALPQSIVFEPDALRRRVWRALAANPPEKVQAHLDSAVAAVKVCIEIDAQAGDGCSVDDSPCTG